MMKRSKSSESKKAKAIDDKSKLLKNIDTAEALAIKPLSYPKNRLIEAQNLYLIYGNKTVIKELSFTINQGDRVALCGRNGCGKSSVIKSILGESITKNGTLNIGTHLKCAYVSQDTSFLKGNLRDYITIKGLDESLFKAILRKLGFSRIQFEIKMQDYSSGQKKKVLLAASLCTPAHLYIWDEPLNFIDVISRIQIEALILRHKPTMLFVEHDRAFMECIATKIVEL